jgi:hypothetical protein
MGMRHEDASYYLHLPKKITAWLDLMAVLEIILTSRFNLGSLFRSTCVRVKLPSLSPCEVVCAKEVWVIGTLSNLQPPHSSAHIHIHKCPNFITILFHSKKGGEN